MALRYKRLLIKFSGEQLASGNITINPTIVGSIAAQLKQAQETGAEIVVVIGAGNLIRGAQVEGDGIERVTADFMGMLSTLINALAINDIFMANGLESYVLTNVKADQVADQYTRRRALHHLHKGRVVVIGGGAGRPYITTDTVALNMALELDCDVVVKVTKVDGVYSKDPTKFADATLVSSMSFRQALEDQAIRIMDKSALAFAYDYKKPIVVCSLEAGDNLRRLVAGEHVGTLING